MKEYDYPDDKPSDAGETAFYNNNPAYGVLDSRLLFVMLRALQPRKMVKVRSAFRPCSRPTSIAVTWAARWISPASTIPYDFLRRGVPGVTRLLDTRLQGFSAADLGLCAGDILFIDTSHVSKLGSDINHIYLGISPESRSGRRHPHPRHLLPHDYAREVGYSKGGVGMSSLSVAGHADVLGCIQDHIRRTLCLALPQGSRRQRLRGHGPDGCSLWLERTAVGQEGGTKGILDSFRTRHLIGVLGRRVASRLKGLEFNLADGRHDRPQRAWAGDVGFCHEVPPRPSEVRKGAADRDNGAVEGARDPHDRAQRGGRWPSRRSPT